MGKHTFTRASYTAATKEYTVKGKEAAHRGRQKVKNTGKLDELVDPAGFNVVRRSNIRFTEDDDNSRYVVNVGTPYPIEYRLDTTGSMGNNVDRALDALPSICELAMQVLPGRDPHFCASIFGDIQDDFALCRGQFEMLADRMVNQLTLMNPEKDGADAAEDPHYGIFGATFLSRLYLQRAGCKSYDFTVTDAPAHDRLSIRQLKRIFGKDVIDHAVDNGHQISANDLPTNREMVQDLLNRAHAFALIVEDSGAGVFDHWVDMYDVQNVIQLPRIELLPHVMATIVGLTENTLDLQSAHDFLRSSNVSDRDAKSVVSAVSGVDLGAQLRNSNFDRLPEKGDVFGAKDDIWPTGEIVDVDDTDTTDDDTDTGGWL